MLIDIDQLSSQVNPNARVIGVDLGDKTIGLALSDTRRKIASPFKLIKRKDFKTDFNDLVNLVEENGVEALIMGMPYNMNGSEGERCKITRKFVQKFLSFYDMPIVLWDERLSTKAADLALLSGGLSSTKRDRSVDKVAAAYILQGALDYITSRVES